MVLKDKIIIDTHSIVKKAGACGTCMMTAVAVGLCSSLEEAKKIFVSEKKQYVPSCENAKIYQKKYDAYKKIYDAVRPIIDEASIKQS